MARTEQGILHTGECLLSCFIPLDVTSERESLMCARPNLFDYAGKELSQDAMICWLIAWAGHGDTEDPEDRALHDCGRHFVRALLRKHHIDLNPSEVIEKTEIHQQDHGIDVLARVTTDQEEYVLLIEDKTDTEDHSQQLQRYYDGVCNGETSLGDDRLSGPRTTTTPPPPPLGISWRRAFPPVRPKRTGVGPLGGFPRSLFHRSTGEVPNYAPAVSPRLRRSPSPWPPCRRHRPTREFPAPLRCPCAPQPSPDPSGSSWWVS